MEEKKPCGSVKIAERPKMSEIEELLARNAEIVKELHELPPGISTHQDILLVAELASVHLKLIMGVQKGMLKEIREMIQ